MIERVAVAAISGAIAAVVFLSMWLNPPNF